MSGEEMSAPRAWRLATDVFALAPGESFVDLGSSFGRLTILVALATGSMTLPARIVGIELSPTRTAAALEAKRRLAEMRVPAGCGNGSSHGAATAAIESSQSDKANPLALAASHLDFIEADVFTPCAAAVDGRGASASNAYAADELDLSAFDVIYCAVQPHAAFKDASQLLGRLVRDYQHKCLLQCQQVDEAAVAATVSSGAAPPRKVRVFTAGFDLSASAAKTKGGGEAKGVGGCDVELVKGHAFLADRASDVAPSSGKWRKKQQHPAPSMESVELESQLLTGGNLDEGRLC